ncbi:MAG: hypothetical protein WCV99_14475 [Sterolibacterium sp.]
MNSRYNIGLPVIAWLVLAFLGGSAGAATPMVVAGASHSCALQSAGTVQCWGANDQGQLGDGTTIDRLVPVRVDGIVDAVSISAGPEATCAVVSHGIVKCWGKESGGGRPAERSLPGAATAVAVGTSDSCAVLQDGRVACWNFGTAAFPVVVEGVAGAVGISVAGGVSGFFANTGRFCAVLVSGEVKCWGNRYWISNSWSSVPVVEDNPTLIAGLTDAVQVSTLMFYSCAVRRSGTVQCWSDFVGPQDPTPAPGISNALQVVLGSPHSCALLANGEIVCLGNNDYGQLGTGSLLSSSSVVKVVGIADSISVAVGQYHTCAVAQAGAVRCWGDFSQGQLGDGSAVKQAKPLLVTGIQTATDVSVGETHVCALLKGGEIACWGQNENGKLGDGTSKDSTSPVRVVGIQDATAVAAGRYHSCALLADRTVKCWGRNISGQLGTGDFVDSLEGVAVVGLSDVKALAAGNSHTCALRVSGDVQCWGSNVYGELGLPASVREQPLPVTISGIDGARSLYATGTFSCALTAAGEVRCWGFDYGVDGRVWRMDVPLSTAIGPRCALTRWGAVWCMPGLFYFSTAQRPIRATGSLLLTTAIEGVSVVSDSCALLLSGSVHCWDGRSWSAQLGIHDAVRLSVDYGTGCAVLASGRIRCWGEDRYGQLGTGRSPGPSLVPQAVSGPGGNGLLNLLDTAQNTEAQDADTVFAFAALSYPEIFEPLASPSFSTGTYRVRQFAGDNYLGVNESGVPHLYYKGPLSNNDILDLGLLSGWLAVSKLY